MEIVKKIAKTAGVFVLLLALVSEVIVGMTKLLYLGKNYPFVEVAGFSVARLNTAETQTILAQKFTIPETIYLKHQDQLLEIKSQDVNLKYDFSQTAQNAYLVGRSGNFFQNIPSLFKKISLPLVYSVDKLTLNQKLKEIERSLKLSPQMAKISVVRGAVTVQNGTDGEELDLTNFNQQLSSMAESGQFSPIVIKTTTVTNKLTLEQLQTAKARGQKLLDKNALLYVDDLEVKVTGTQLVSLVDPAGGVSQTALEELTKEVATQVSREPQNPIFVVNGDKVSEFAPSKDGLMVKQKDLEVVIIQILDKLENNLLITYSSEIPVERTPSEYKTQDVNNLGINELIGVGESDFKGSIPSRIHNVKLAASKFQGIVVKPQETVSFNKILGDVSVLTGYQQAYIIKDGATILGDGGGVCQVSSTMFRAALNTGLPIIERRAHAYRVYYYEQNSQPGLDATVYDPSPDLKFKNDTPNHILIQTKMDEKNSHLTVEIYGTSDGRKATISKSTVTDIIPPPEDIYTDDPTLPAGTIKQVDHKASGAKITFNYTVERGGETIFQKTFVSVYQPWSAKFLRGTGLTN